MSGDKHPLRTTDMVDMSVAVTVPLALKEAEIADLTGDAMREGRVRRPSIDRVMERAALAT